MSFWSKAKSLGSSISSAISKGLNVVGAAGSTWFSGIISILTLEPLLVTFGFLTPRSIRMRVVVLADDKGPLLGGVTEGRSDDVGQGGGTGGVVIREEKWDHLFLAIDEARRIFKDEVNVSLLPRRNIELVRVLQDPAPLAALRVGCGTEAFNEHHGAAGQYFQANSTPSDNLTVFIVESVSNGAKWGCSLGPLADYVTVAARGVTYDKEDADGVPQREPGFAGTLAHEIGHSGNLWHPGHDGGLMKPGQPRTHHLQRWQQLIFRASPRVHF